MTVGDVMKILAVSVAVLLAGCAEPDPDPMNAEFSACMNAYSNESVSLHERTVALSPCLAREDADHKAWLVRHGKRDLGGIAINDAGTADRANDGVIRAINNSY